MEPYEKLANAIILQAVNDYRRAKKYLAKHPRTEELEKTVAAQIAEKEKRRRERKTRNLPKELEKKSREERLLDAILANETAVYDAEKFFRSDWFSELTTLDGEILLEKLKRETGGEAI